MDNGFDQALLDSLIDQLVTPQCFDVDFALARDEAGGWMIHTYELYGRRRQAIGRDDAGGSMEEDDTTMHRRAF